MSTFERVIEFAVKQLDQRGLVLNRQIEQLSDGNERLLQSVRSALTTAGIAEDRMGMGLGRVGKPGVCVAAWKSGRLADPSDDSSCDIEFASADECESDADWWVMSDGNVRGPWTIQQLTSMCSENELSPTDLIRCGTRGMWLKPHEVPELESAIPAYSTPVPELIPVHSSLSEESDSNQELPKSNVDSDFEIESDSVEETTTVARVPDADRFHDPLDVPVPATGDAPIAPLLPAPRTGAVSARPMRSPSEQFGLAAVLRALGSIPSVLVAAARGFVFSPTGSRVVLVVALIVAARGIWWLWPPSSASIIQQFEQVHERVKELQLTRKSDTQLKKELTADRDRVRGLVKVLEWRASNEPSVHRELLNAGKHGLLVILDYPRKSDRFEGIYAIHIKNAKLLLEGRPIEKPAEPPLAPANPPQQDETQSIPAIGPENSVNQ